MPNGVVDSQTRQPRATCELVHAARPTSSRESGVSRSCTFDPRNVRTTLRLVQTRRSEAKGVRSSSLEPLTIAVNAVARNMSE